MDLKNIAMPDVDRWNIRPQELAREMLSYMTELEKQLRYVLGNLDEGNLNDGLMGKIRDAEELTKAFRRVFEAEDAASAFEQTAQRIGMSVRSGQVINEINLDKTGAQIRAAKIALEGLTTINGAFKVLLDGSFEATGGRIGGWTVNDKALFAGEEQRPEMYLGTEDLQDTVSIAGSSERRDWRMKAGSGFGVTKDGAMYCESGVFRGTVSAGNIMSGQEYGKLEGGAIVDHSVGETQMEEAYAAMKDTLSGAYWMTATIGGKQVQVLVKEAAAE